MANILLIVSIFKRTHKKKVSLNDLLEVGQRAEARTLGITSTQWRGTVRPGQRRGMVTDFKCFSVSGIIVTAAQARSRSPTLCPEVEVTRSSLAPE